MARLIFAGVWLLLAVVAFVMGFMDMGWYCLMLSNIWSATVV